ncbi:alpha/beta hydrolase [Amycolatopsis roodepoortensis]|uniref:alpha/beta fold hydrolase n=1 Tax=Amycolatopsis roodepoortensis TaxID=700274 RepID=UPI00214B1BFA|nr:alpha/beta hydrolase [Amycolatopsis roodepoortensis]UUV35878.1 alpha/beta hydrolase [Amycolatopsis roodepoortensis]
MPRPDLDALNKRVDHDRAAIDTAMTTQETPDGSTIRIARIGTGPTVVCLPMITELNFVYLPQVQALSDQYEFVIYEPRLSRTHRVSAADRARELRTVIDTVGAESAHLLAWSDAGSAAYLACRWWPERIRSAVFLGLADHYTFPQPIQMLTHALDRFPIEKAFPPPVLGRLISHYLGGSKIPPRWVYSETRRIPQLRQLFKYSVLPCFRDHQPDSEPFPVPALLIGGDKDALVTPAQMRNMARLLNPDREAVIVPGGEHILGYATPEPVNDAVRDFYNVVDARASRTQERHDHP